MLLKAALTVSALAAAVCSAGAANTTTTLPSLDVPACPSKGRLAYNQTSPDRAAFPETAVEACYDGGALRVDLLAYGEASFFYNASLATNGDLYNYEVMEVFMAPGTGDPQTYLEFEVAPNNVTFQVSPAVRIHPQGTCPKEMRKIPPSPIQKDPL